MIIIQKKTGLAEHNTLRIGGPARYYVEVRTKNELLEALSWAKNKNIRVFVLGGGSNTFFGDQGFPGLVIKNKIRGIRIMEENADYVWLEADGGEWWMTLVDYCLSNKYYGLENLAAIPGSVGAAPIQNIGAYGVELKDVLANLTAINIRTLKEKKFNLTDCRFKYRDSIFKNKLKDKYFIYSIVVRLSKKPKFNLTYPDLATKFSSHNPAEIAIRDVAKKIIEIRNSKLPVPAVLPNAGSFFKNVELSKIEFTEFIKKFPEAKYNLVSGKYQVPTAWLIDQCGFKGQRINLVGVYEKQPLVLVNYGGAKARELMALAKKISSAVKRKFGLELEMEVNFIK